MKGKLLFIEKQSFNGTWAYYLSLIVAGGITSLLGYGVIQQLILGQPFGTKPVSDTGLILIFLITSAITIGITIWFRFLTLSTSVDEGYIYFRFPPFVKSQRKNS